MKNDFLCHKVDFYPERLICYTDMADNQLNAKPVVRQIHPGYEFPVSQRGSTIGKQSMNAQV